jgi:tetratricopeptide (TPR) repeat protein
MKKHLTLIILLLGLLPAALTAQTPRSDSLLAVLKKDSTNFEVLMELAKAYVDIDNTKAIGYGKKAQSFALETTDSLSIIKSSRIVGQLYNRLGAVDLAIKELLPILPFAEAHLYKEEVKMILNSLAASFTYKAEYDKALEYHFKSLVLREQEQNRQDISIALNNIGVVYTQLGNFEQALVYFKRCLEIKESINDNLDLDRLFLNLASCHTQLKNSAEAESYFDRAIGACKPNCTKVVLIVASHGKGQLYLYQADSAAAEKSFLESLALSISDNNLHYQLSNLVKLAQLALQKGKVIELGYYLGRIESLSGKEQFLEDMQSYYELSSRYNQQIGHYEKALLLQRKYSDVAEKISNSSVRMKIMDVQVRFAERENLQKLLVQEKLLEAQRLVIQKQGIINFLFFGLAFLAGLLAIALFKMNRRKTAINKILDQLVRERTFELENSRNKLVHSYNEQRIVLDKVSSSLISALATLKGLSHLTRLERPDLEFSYADQAAKTVQNVLDTVRAGQAIGAMPEFDR